MESVDVRGHWESRFDPVVREFERNFVERGEIGAALSVIIDGTAVLEIYGGLSDRDERRAWQRDTLVDIYSAAKPLVAMSLLRLVDHGLVNLDDPIATWWPEFAAHGKERATIRHALCHRAGVPAIREELTNEDLWDWNRMCDALARSAPYFEPGTRHMYHTNTYGHLIGEITRRVSHKMPSEALADIASALGADVHVGLSEQDQRRCATVIFDVASSPVARRVSTPSREEDPTSSMVMRGYFNPPGYSSFDVVNTPEWRSSQIPSTNTHGTASGLATMYAGVLQENRVLSVDLLDEATRAQSSGFCPVLGEETVFALGFKPTSLRRPFGTHGKSFGHYGTGGAVGFADPDERLAFGYVMNHVIPRWQSSRNRALIDSLYEVIDPS